MRLVFILVLTALSICGQAWASLFDAREFTLDNGLRVVVLSDHRAPAVTQMVWYQAGSADEVPGKTGIAHFLEHLMFKGTQKFPNDSFIKLVSHSGGQQNAFTSYDVTTYHQTVHKDQIRQVMEMEADRMRGLNLTEEDVATELKVILDERRVRIDSRPSGLLGEQANAMMFANHPYGQPVIGWRHEMELFTRTDALDWYNRYYWPNNAILILAGDITFEQAELLARETYGPIASGHIPVRQRPKEPEPNAARIVTMASPLVQNLIWSRSYLAPSATEGESHHAQPLEVVAQILGGGANSRLYLELVKKRGLASAAVAYYDPLYRDPTEFQIQVIGRANVSADKIATAVDQVLEDFIRKGPTADELDRVKSGMIAQASYARDSVSAAAHLIGQALSVGLNVGNLEAWPAEIEKIESPDIVAGSKFLFRPERSVTAILSPSPKPESAAKTVPPRKKP